MSKFFPLQGNFFVCFTKFWWRSTDSLSQLDFFASSATEIITKQEWNPAAVCIGARDEHVQDLIALEQD